MRISDPSQPPPRLLPGGWVWALVAGSLGLAAALLPSKRQLVSRLLEDGENQRAREIARASGEPMAPFYNGTPAAPLDRLRLALMPDYRGPGAVAALAIENAADPDACLALVHRMEGHLPPEKRRPLYIAIIRSAFARNDPEQAARIAGDAIHQGVADSVIRLTAVRAWRWSGRTSRALEVFDEWRSNDVASLTPAAEETEITLCRELGKNERALALLQTRCKAAGPPGSVPAELMQQVVIVASQAGKGAEVLPVLTDWILAQPGGTASWDELASGTVQPEPAFRHWAGLLAQHSEWNGQPGTALDWYLKLAVLGDAHALGRAAELQKGLNRSLDWMGLLQRLVPVVGKPHYTRELARLLAGAGLYDKAPAIYDLWLKDHPDDTSALAELGGMYSEIPEPEKALALYERVAALDPANLEARKEIAGLRLVLKDFDGAFALYQSLPEEAHDATTLENFSLLAESLGDYHAYHRSLLMRYRRLQKPAGPDFLELARSYELTGQPEGAITALREGLRRLPSSRLLRTHLAQVWRNHGQYDEAIRLLAVPSLHSDLQAMSLFIEVCCLKEDYQQAFAFLGRGIEKKFGFPPDVRLDLGHIYFNNGYMTEADALYSSVPDEPSLWPLIANARFRRGDLAGAEAFQRRHLAAVQVPDAPGWLLMGDILRAGGREAEARQAYQKGLRLMEQKLESPAVENAGAPDKKPRLPATAYHPRPAP